MFLERLFNSTVLLQLTRKRQIKRLQSDLFLIALWKQKAPERMKKKEIDLVIAPLAKRKTVRPPTSIRGKQRVHPPVSREASWCKLCAKRERNCTVPRGERRLLAVAVPFCWCLNIMDLWCYNRSQILFFCNLPDVINPQCYYRNTAPK